MSTSRTAKTVPGGSSFPTNKYVKLEASLIAAIIYQGVLGVSGYMIIGHVMSFPIEKWT
jgi:hypothetical protein